MRATLSQIPLAKRENHSNISQILNLILGVGLPKGSDRGFDPGWNPASTFVDVNTAAIQRGQRTRLNKNGWR